MSAKDGNDDLIKRIENSSVIRRLRRHYRIDISRDVAGNIALVIFLRKEKDSRTYPVIIYGDRKAKTPIEHAAEMVALVWHIKTDRTVVSNRELPEFRGS